MRDERPRDMIVPLLALPDAGPLLERVAGQGVIVRRAKPWDLGSVRGFAGTHFSARWRDEISCAWGRTPISAFVAVEDEEIVGFAGHHCAAPGVFGPTGVREDRRGRDIGAALLFRCLLDMRALGYIYAIIGAVGPASYYEKVCGALLLPAEWPSYVTTPD